ncbi:MAG TPA: PhzF family phenazine biosynthesis protein [Acidimicrobiales bacterium]|jgi:predicted PhzF superfamily epimerase YddE/YHI9
MGQPISVVDAFTEQPFGGNPAAVCVLPHAADEAWMRSVAAEMNLSETAFLVPRPDGDHDLRWFTPTVEIALCGHATLASAHVLGRQGRFHTLSGLLTCSPCADGTIEMDFPAHPVTEEADPPAWGPALGLDPDRILRSYASAGWGLVEVATADDVVAVVMDRDALMALGGHALVVADTTADDSPYDSVCRMFGPASGIDEDPVTGSAHCVIAPWLAARHGRADFLGQQASDRVGVVGMRLHDDRVTLIGHAVTVWEGTLHSDPPPA